MVSLRPRRSRTRRVVATWPLSRARCYSQLHWRWRRIARDGRAGPASSSPRTLPRMNAVCRCRSPALVICRQILVQFGTALTIFQPFSKVIVLSCGLKSACRASKPSIATRRSRALLNALFSRAHCRPGRRQDPHPLSKILSKPRLPSDWLKPAPFDGGRRVAASTIAPARRRPHRAATRSSSLRCCVAATASVKTFCVPAPVS